MSSLVTDRDLRRFDDPLERAVDTLIDDIKEKSEDIQANWPELGQLLNELCATTGKGPPFNNALRRTNVKLATANYLRALVSRFQMLEIDPPRDVSWVKLMAVQKCFTPLNFEWIIQYCRRFPLDELIAMREEGFFE